VGLADAIVEQGYLELTSDAGILTDASLEFLRRTDIETGPLLKCRTRWTGRALFRPCLDWSERRMHIAGLLGATICSHSFEAEWTPACPTAALCWLVTPTGERTFRERFRVQLANGCVQR
jgi:hypothetical protein